MFNAIIVENDPMIIQINREYAEASGKITIVNAFINCEKALDYLAVNPIDLILLAVNLPGMSGPEFLRKLRNMGGHQDVIMVTAVHDPKTVENVFAYGVLDFIIKPYERERFNSAINHFVDKRELLQLTDRIDQDIIDRAYVGDIIESALSGDKGIQPVTLGKIGDYLRSHRNAEHTIDSLAKELDMSKVTLRRYMNYLIKKNRVSSTIDYCTGGRPSAIYNYIGY